MSAERPDLEALRRKVVVAAVAWVLDGCDPGPLRRSVVDYVDACCELAEGAPAVPAGEHVRTALRELEEQARKERAAALASATPAPVALAPAARPRGHYWTPEQREAARQRMLARIAEGKMGRRPEAPSPHEDLPIGVNLTGGGR